MRVLHSSRFVCCRDRGRTSVRAPVEFESGNVWQWLYGDPLTSFLLPSTASTEASAARPLSSGGPMSLLLATMTPALRSYEPGDWHRANPIGLYGGAAIPIVPASMQWLSF